MTPDEARAALANRPSGHSGERGPQFSAEEKATRVRLSSKAQGMAYVSLKALHPDEYQALYQTARADLLAEAGLS